MFVGDGMVAYVSIRVRIKENSRTRPVNPISASWKYHVHAMENSIAIKSVKSEPFSTNTIQPNIFSVTGKYAILFHLYLMQQPKRLLYHFIHYLTECLLLINILSHASLPLVKTSGY